MDHQTAGDQWTEIKVATGELLAELVRAHFEEQSTRFGSILNQVIAAEARAGHSQVARRLRELRDAGSVAADNRPPATARAVPLARTVRPLADVIDVAYSDHRLDDLILPPELLARVEAVVIEQRQAELLAQHFLQPRRKLLLHGAPGTGKTLTAYAIAGELSLPVARIRLEVLFSRYLGETASTLADIFAEATRLRAVYLFDEFDALGSHRSDSGDVGEMRRVVGTFLQLLDADQSASIFIAATNLLSRVDPALFRRFDDVLAYPDADDASRELLLERGLRSSRIATWDFRDLARQFPSLSLADITTAVTDARKAAVLRGGETPDRDELQSALQRRSAHTSESRF